MEEIGFNTFVSDITQSTKLAIHPGCNSWMAVNFGDDIAVVNGVTLNPSPGPGLTGDVTGVAGNYGEVMNVAQVDVRFLSAINPRVQFVQKVYAFSKFR